MSDRESSKSCSVELNYLCLEIQLVAMEIVKVTVFVDEKIYVTILTDKFEMHLYVDWLLSLSCEWKMQRYELCLEKFNFSAA
jgi:hypothetical protein